jgi:hypothetical protein
MLFTRKRIFIGPVNSANLANLFADAFNANGLRADFISFSPTDHPFRFKQGKQVFQMKEGALPTIFRKNIPSVLNSMLVHLYLIIWTVKYDVFIFISPRTILANQRDLPWIRFFRKKIIFIFAGCPERDPHFLPSNPEYICNRCTDQEKQQILHCQQIERKRTFIERLEDKADYILSQDDSASFLRYRKPVWLYIPVPRPEPSDFLLKHRSDRIKIVHFPSNPVIKLSHFIIPVLKQLSDNYPNLEIVLKTNISHMEVLEELKTAHVLVDCLGLGYGVLAIEAMARGCVVVTGRVGFFERQFPQMPVIASTTGSLYTDMEGLLLDRQRLTATAKRSMDFYERYHTYAAVTGFYKRELHL